MVLTRFYEFGLFRFDASAHVPFRDGKRLVCPRSGEAEGNVVSKDKLLKTVWLDSFVEEGSLTSHISLLRKTLGETDLLLNGPLGSDPLGRWSHPEKACFGLTKPRLPKQDARV